VGSGRARRPYSRFRWFESTLLDHFSVPCSSQGSGATLKGKTMSQDYKQTLRELDLPGSDFVTLTYSDGADVLHYQDGAVNDAVSETDVVNRFSNLVMALGGARRDGILEELADACVIELPDPDDESAEPIDSGFLAEAIENNFYDQEFIEHSTKKYDHKRGYCTLTATIEATIDELLDLNDESALEGWTLDVETKKGMLSIKV